MPKTRVLVVDDSTVMRRLITEAVSRDPEFEVACTSSNGKLALERLSQQSIDAVVLDVEMPEMDGMTALHEMRRLYPKLTIIMCSTVTKKGASITLEALDAGANDYVTKPTQARDHEDAIQRLAEDLLPRLRIHRGLVPARSQPVLLQRPVHERAPKDARPSPIEWVLIGTSTGGPNALAEIVRHLPADLEVPVLVVQHMPPVFTSLLADRLGALGTLQCHEAEEGQRPLKGHLYLAPGGRHMEISEQKADGAFALHLTDGAAENSCRPSVDVLFRSVSQHVGGRVLAVVLTGMGQDGFRGCEHLREQGAQIVVQDEASSVVWGMPGYIAQNGLADRILPLHEIAGEVLRRIRASAVPVSPATTVSCP